MGASVRGARSSDVFTDAQKRFSLVVPAGNTVDLEVLHRRTCAGNSVLTGPSRYRGSLTGVTAPARAW